jgi:hypothetical protein
VAKFVEMSRCLVGVSEENHEKSRSVSFRAEILSVDFQGTEKKCVAHRGVRCTALHRMNCSCVQSVMHSHTL